MLKFLKYTFFTFIFICLLIGGAGFYLYKTFDPNNYKQKIENLASKALNRQVSIKGDINLALSLIPTIEVNGIEISNPSWATSPYFFNAKQVEVSFEIMPLLQKKQIAIDSVDILEPSVHLEIAENGKQNWVFVDEKAENIPTDTLKKELEKEFENNAVVLSTGSFLLNKAKITDGTVEYKDNKAKQNYKIKINSLVSDYIDEDTNLGLTADIQYLSHRIKGHFASGTLDQIINMTPDLPINVDLKINNSSVVFNGSISELSENAKIKGKINLYNPAGGFDLPETTLISEIDATTTKVSAKISTLNIATNLITGNISADLSGKKPYVNANLNSKLINLESLNTNSSAVSYTPSLIGDANAAIFDDNFKKQKIDYSLLNLLNGKFNLVISKLILNDSFIVNNLNISAAINNGSLKASPITMTFEDGSVNIDTQVNAADSSLNLKISTNDLLIQDILPELKSTNVDSFAFISGGKIDIKADLSSQGNTYGDILKNLNGNFIGIIDKSKIQTGEFKIMTSNFVSQLLQTLKIYKTPEAKTTLNCAVLRTDIKNGIADFPNGIAIDTKNFTLISKGSVNLYKETLDLSLKPSSRNLKNTNISQAISSLIKIKGTFDNPRIGIDDAGAIKTIVGVVTTGPVALGSQILLDGDDNPCYTALKGSSEANRFPAPSGIKSNTKETYSKTSDAISSGINDITGATSSILKGTAGGIANLLSGKKKSNKK